MLDPNWQVQTKNKLLALKQGDMEFLEYFWKAHAINNQLKNLPQYLQHAAMRPILENGMEPELQRLALQPSVASIEDETDWIIKVREIDLACRKNQRAINDQVQKAFRRTAATWALTPRLQKASRLIVPCQPVDQQVLVQTRARQIAICRDPPLTSSEF